MLVPRCWESARAVVDADACFLCLRVFVVSAYDANAKAAAIAATNTLSGSDDIAILHDTRVSAFSELSWQRNVNAAVTRSHFGVGILRDFGCLTLPNRHLVRTDRLSSSTLQSQHRWRHSRVSAAAG